MDIQVDPNNPKNLSVKYWRAKNAGMVRFTCELCRFQCLEKSSMVVHRNSKKHQERLILLKPGELDLCLISHAEMPRKFMFRDDYSSDPRFNNGNSHKPSE